MVQSMVLTRPKTTQIRRVTRSGPHEVATLKAKTREERMPELRGSETEANLRAAFAREIEANGRYLYFAQQADVEGQPEAAALFRAIAEGELGHALGHLDFLADVGDPATDMAIGSTEENLASAATGERAEADEHYPEFGRVARAEGFGEIADWLESLSAAEGAYADRLAAALDELN